MSKSDRSKYVSWPIILTYYKKFVDNSAVLQVWNIMGGPLKLYRWNLNCLHLSCQNKIFASELQDLRNYLSDWVEIFRNCRGVNRIAVLKFQSILITLRKNVKTGNFRKISPQMCPMVLWKQDSIKIFLKSLLQKLKWLIYSEKVSLLHVLTSLTCFCLH